MDTNRNLLFGALALKTGLIDSQQFTESCKHWEKRPQQSLPDILVELGWIADADTPHLEYLLQRELSKHAGDAKAAFAALPSVIKQSLAALQVLDTEGTIAVPGRMLKPPPPSTPTGDPTLDLRYTFMGIHAAGGIGQIWRARDCHLEREVAIKELRPERADDAKVTARFVREARLTGQLEHPGIVPVYELAFRSDTKQPFYTMRLVRGRTLAGAIDAYHAKRAQGRAEPLDFVTLLTSFVAVCNTIAYAHSRGVLHRDLKGENVVLGDFGEVIVLDWGLAKLLGQPDLEDSGQAQNEVSKAPSNGPLENLTPIESGVYDSALTVQGEIVGTPSFMAPEQAEGRPDRIDQRTDIYGLGAMLYTILAGRPPFMGANVMEVLQKAARGNPTPPRQICPEAPAALEELCLRAMAKDRDSRFASAADLAQEVQRWQDVQRRQAEDALRRHTEVLRSILNGMSEGVFVADAEGKLILINPAAERMIGSPSEATLAATRGTSEFYRPDAVTPLDVQDLPSARAIRGEDVDEAEMFVRPLHTGEGIWVSANARPLRDESNSVRGGVVVFRDISAHKRAEEERNRLLDALRASEEEYRSLADLIPGIVWTARPDGWINYANHFWLNFTGMTMAETEGSGWAAAVHPEDVPRVSELWAKSLATGQPIEVEYRLKRADGVFRWFLAQGRPLRDREGRVAKWFGMLTEIEDQKQSEKALERQNALVRLLHKVTVAAYEAASVEEALQAGIDQVCTYTGWPVGHVYVLAGDGAKALDPTTIWHLDRPKEFESFVRVTEATRLPLGAGLPGRVLAGKAPAWIMDVTRDDNFPRAKAATNIGVKGAFAFPVLTGAGVVAVLEFFTSEPREPD
ncbi:MAG: PAS domain S-box protein, partial [Gemmataceae bacterium]|nr:PAS domain S-box protein [Gemmataceae bacterium]